MSKSHTVDRLCLEIAAAGLPAPEREYHFAPVDDTGCLVRQWRADLAWPDVNLMLEVDGGLYGGGRHGGARSVWRDLEKRNAATLLGFRTVHVTPTDVKSGLALLLLEVAFGQRNVGEVL